MKRFVFFVLSCFCCTLDVVLCTSRTEILNKGGTFQMSCQVELDADSLMIWGRNSKYGEGIIPHYVVDERAANLSSSVDNVVNDGRSEVERKVNNVREKISVRYDGLKTYTLSISSLTESDEADYTCSILRLNNNNNNTGVPVSSSSNFCGDAAEDGYQRDRTVTVVSEVALRIIRPAVILANSSSTQRVFEGQNVMLFCYTSGYPKPVVLWKRGNENDFMATGGHIHPYPTLEFKATAKEAGVYKCMAFNGVGAIAFRTINLVVSPVLDNDED